MLQLALVLSSAALSVAEKCDAIEDSPLLQSRQHVETGLAEFDGEVRATTGANNIVTSTEVDSENAEVSGLMASGDVWELFETAPDKFWAYVHNTHANLFGDPVMRKQVENAEVPTLSEEQQLALASTNGARLVLSDLDDTIICSAATIFHGIDKNCAEKGEVYPGVAQFQLELGLGPSADTPAIAPPPVVPVSARPQELKFILAIKPSKPIFKFYANLSEKMFGSQDAWGLDLVNAQYGSIFAGSSVALNKFDRHLPWLKYTGWLNVRSLGFPTVFVGDNGQGDARAAELMLSRKHSVDGSIVNPLLGSFIHHIQPLRINSAEMNTSWASGRDGTQGTLASYGIHLFHNYAHAACIAYKKGFISDSGYSRIMQSILDECNGELHRRLCTLLNAEFEFGADGQSKARAAADCEKSMSSAEGLLQAEEVFMVDGHHMIGRCDELDSDLFTRLTATKEQVSKLESGYVYWALNEGTYCTTRCGETCSEAAQKDLSWDGSWNFVETSSYSGDLVTCPNPLHRSSICEVVDF